MTGRFGAAAMHLCALAARALGWRAEEFWRATPAELAACLADPSTTAAAPLGRGDLQRLMESDPDGHG